MLAAFRKGLSETGFVEGRNLAIEFRWGLDSRERQAEAAADMVRRKVDVIVAPGFSVAALAAKALTATIPIVFTTSGDPVQLGLVASLNQPGGNVTGLSIQQSDTTAKRLELLRELVPNRRRVAVIAHVASAGAMSELRELHALAPTLGLQVSAREIQQLEDIAPALEAFTGQADALYIVTDPLFYANRQQILSGALEARLLTICNYREYTEAGCLLSYGPHQPDLMRRAADFVDKILRGTKPADIPVEQPTRFDLVINLRTAQALDLTIPPLLLFQADQVIQ